MRLKSNELKELCELIGKMNLTQLGKFLTIFVLRTLVDISNNDKDFFVSADKNKVHYLNNILFLLSLNFIYYFDNTLTKNEENKLAVFFPNLQQKKTNAYSKYKHQNPTLKALNCALNIENFRGCTRKNDIEQCTLYKNSTTITLEDAKNILINKDKFFNIEDNGYFEKFVKCLSELKGEFWAIWFDKIFKNDFVFEKRDTVALLSFEEILINTSISTASSHLYANLSGNVVDNNEIRLMILGEKGEGKTSFAERFQELDSNMPNESESTEGVVIDEVYLEDINDRNSKYKKNVRIKIWDFAGHEVTHAVHKFFLSDKCVYVIVCQARRDERSVNAKIGYWLEHIRDYAGIKKCLEDKKIKIFILINEFDENVISINEASIKNDYQNYELIFKYINIKYDNQKRGKLNEFRHELFDYIQSIDTKIPICYKKMQERIRSRFEKSNFVEKTKIEAIIEDVKSSDENIVDVETRQILESLHAYAFCFWFDINEIRTVVLNPRWITSAVYSIINYVQNNNTGIPSIKKSNLSNILKRMPNDFDLPIDIDKLLFGVMEQFELAYSDDEETLVIPHCLKDSYPNNEIGLNFEFLNSVQVDVRIEAEDDSSVPRFPISTIPRFIVKKYNNIYKRKGNPIISKNKAMFEIEESIAEIMQRNDYSIIITVQAKYSSSCIIEKNIKHLCDFIACLNNVLLEHRRFQSQKPKISYRATDINGKPRYLPIDELKNNEIEKIQEYRRLKLKKGETDRINLFIKKDVTNIFFVKGDIAMGDNIKTKNGDVSFVKANDISGTIVQQSVGVASDVLKTLLDEILKARKIVGSAEIEKEYKDSFLSLSQKVETDISKNDMNSCKSKFENFKDFAKKAVEKILPLLKHLPTLTKYLGG